MEWCLDNGPSDTDPEKTALTLFLKADEFTEKIEILYEKYGFIKHEDNKMYSIDLDAILQESCRVQRLNETVTSLVKALGQIKDEIAKKDAERLKSEMTHRIPEGKNASSKEA